MIPFVPLLVKRICQCCKGKNAAVIESPQNIVRLESVPDAYQEENKNVSKGSRQGS